MRHKSLNLGILLPLAFGVLILDQVSKWYILNYLLKPGEFIEVTSFFDLVLVWNRGVSFGFLGKLPMDLSLVLGSFSVVMSLIMLIWFFKSKGPLMHSGLSLMIGGAIGNALDRFRFAAVTDFLHFHWAEYSFPAFNIADSAITIGVGLILLDNFWHHKGAKNDA